MREQKTSAVRSGLFSLGGVLVHILLFVPLQDMGFTPAFIKLDTADDNAKTVFFTLNLVFGSFGALCL
jgi:hypothetical protein